MATLFLIIASGMVAVYFYRNEIIAVFIKKANNYLNTPVDVQSVDMNVWERFPNITFTLKEVKIHESTQLAGDYLCKAEKIGISFDVFQLLFNQYVLKSLSVNKASINMALDKDGINNFDILKKTGQSRDTGVFDFSLQNIILSDVSFKYLDLGTDLSLDIQTEKLTTRFKKSGRTISVQATGDVHNHQLKINQISYLKDQILGLSTRFKYNLDSKDLYFDESKFDVNSHTYLISGSIKAGKEKFVDLQMESSENNLQAIVSLLPRKWRDPLKAYKTKGGISFSGAILGSFKEGQIPGIHIDFSCSDVDFYHPEHKKSFRDLRFTGHFSNGDKHSIQSSIIEIKGFSGKIDEHEIRGNLLIEDLKLLNTELDMAGTLDFNSFLKTFRIKQIRRGDGLINFNVQLRGKVRELKENKTSNIRTSGEIELKNVDFLTVYSDLPFAGINGSLFFNNLDMGIQDLKGTVGKSDIGISGMFRNIVPYLLYKDRMLYIEADMVSSYLDLNELLTLNFNPRTSEEQSEKKYHLGISPKLDLDFNCRIKQTDLKRFHGENISGNLTIRDQIAVIEDVAINSMGGKLILSGSVVARDQNKREFMVDGILENIHIDQVFFVFNNFNQQFLVDRNLKGQVDAVIHTYFEMDEGLHFFPESLNTFTETRIKNGQLIDFTPIQSLSKYMKNEDLSNLKFSDLQNSIRIHDRTVFIPDMEITSTEYEINVSGTHTFDQEIDYHFKIPLDQFRRDDPDERFGEVDDSGSGPPNLFLKMTGTAKDYKVSYDTKAVKEKIREDLVNEGNEIRDLFRKSEDTEKEQLELEEDEYFDFEKN